MLIDQYITESYSNDFVPTNEAWITGEGNNELYQISNEAMESYNTLFENMMFAESIATIQNLNGLNESAQMLLEKSKQGFWKGLKETLIKWKNQIIEYFKKLWASIRVKLKASDAALSKAEALIKKNDLTGFTYQGYNWKDSSIYNTISANAKSLIDDFSATIDTIKDGMETDAKTGKDLEMKIYGRLVRSSDSTRLTHAQAIDDIKKAYGCEDDTKSTLSGSASTISNMIAYLKTFNNNKVIKEAEKALTQNIEKTIKAVSDFESKSEEITKSINGQINGMKATLKAAQALMSTCISMERQKYADYKSTVLEAMHYNNKSK